MAKTALCLILFIPLTMGGCERRVGGSVAPPPPPAPAAQALNSIPLGAPPGQLVSVAQSIKNPFEGQPQAIAEGKALFGSMNCVYCHAPGGAGLMGPALNGRGWRYGGTPAEIYNSIHDGRPKGMPAWGERLPPDEIWKLVVFIESLGGATAPAAPSTLAMATSQPSSTGPQPAGQAKADSSQESLMRSDLDRGR